MRIGLGILSAWLCMLLISLHGQSLRALADVLPPGTPQGPLGYVPTYDDPMPAFAWQGAWQSRAIWVPSGRTGADLYATVFAPAAPPDHRLPAVVILPGSIIGTQANYQWSARDLAGHGYVAITIDPQGEGHSQEVAVPPCQKSGVSTSCGDLDQPSFFSTKNWIDALESGIDFLTSAQDPFGYLVDPNEVGAAGHSLGAGVVEQMQSVDPRIKAIVAWDNLDSGPSDPCNKVDDDTPDAIGTQLTPRVPALGEGSETCESAPAPVSGKLGGFELWRSHRLATMEVVFAGAQHLDFGQGTLNGLTGTPAQLDEFEYYTRAWFDLFLRHDPTAITRLLATTIDGTPRASLLSARFTSATYLPQAGVYCPNLASCPPASSALSSPTSRLRARLSVHVQPRQVVVGRRVRLLVRVTVAGRRVMHAAVSIDGRRAQTKRDGIAKIAFLRFPHPGRWIVHAAAHGFAAGRAILGVVRWQP